MMPSARYTFAFAVNVALPAAAYWAAKPLLGLTGALAVSALPLLAWMTLDLLRFRHFDALSAVVLAGIVLSILMLVAGTAGWPGKVREPLVSGTVGVLFLLSLPARRPLVYYLARSTLARERSGREREFDAMWDNRPALRKSIRLMTAVWGAGLVGENVVRLWIATSMAGESGNRLSTVIRYATYAALTGWTIAYRRWYIRQQA